jgi:hypothetical protein
MKEPKQHIILVKIFGSIIIFFMFIWVFISCLLVFDPWSLVLSIILGFMLMAGFYTWFRSSWIASE